MTTPTKPASETLPDWVRSDIEKRIRSRMLELPILPAVAVETLHLCGRQDADANQIASILHRDQALAGNVMRVANSPLFGATIEITSLQQAISRVGLRMIREVVLAVATNATVFEAPAAWRSCVVDLPRLSLLSGLYATHVARACHADEDTAFLAGFLHDMGWSVVMFLMHKLEAQQRQKLDVSVVQAAGNLFHAEVGAELARSWSVSEDAVTAIRHHEDWSEMDTIPRGAPLVSMADQLARFAMSGFPDTEESVLNHPAVRPLDLDPKQLRTLFDMKDRILKLSNAVI